MGGGTLSHSEHWDAVYRGHDLEELSWHEAEPGTSLRLLRAFARPPAAVLDVGAGASALPFRLLAAGWQDVTVLDVSEVALEALRDRLLDQVHYVAADLLTWTPERTFSAWHDRAVFHFLTEPADQDAYVGLAAQAVHAGGVVLLGCFALDGPTSCSGLPTTRWSADTLAAAFRTDFELVHAERDEHVTPTGVMQPFTWVVLRRRERHRH